MASRCRVLIGTGTYMNRVPGSCRLSSLPLSSHAVVPPPSLPVMTPTAVSPTGEPFSETLEALTATFDDTLRFYLNGTKVVLDDVDPEITVLEYLRGIGLTGTKLYVTAHTELMPILEPVC